MLLRLCTLPEIRQRPLRALLTLLGLALGVAVWVAAVSVSRTARTSYQDLFDRVAGTRALEIVASDLAGFDPGFAGRLLQVPGVTAVQPRIVMPSALSVQGRISSSSLSVLILGLDGERAIEQSNLEVTSGEPFGDALGVWMDERLAAAASVPGSTLACQPGQEVELLTPGGVVPLPIQGLIRASGLAAQTAVPILCLPLHQAQQLFHLPGRVNSVQVLLAEDIDLPTGQARLGHSLPEGLRIQPPGARADLASNTMQAACVGLDGLAWIALAVAAFVMLNTFLLNLSERRRRLALLTVLGATRRQVRRLLLVEALVMGLLGGLLGLLGGLLLQRLLLRAVGLWGIEPAAGPIPVLVLVFAPIAGLATSILAVLIAFAQSERLSPLDSVNDRLAGHVASPGRSLVGIRVSAALATGLLLYFLATSAPPVLIPSLLGPAAVGGLVGCVLALPLWTRWLLSVLGSCSRGWASPELELALHQLTRRLPRSGLAVAIFFIATASATAFGHSLTNTLADLQRWYQRTIVADFLIRGSQPDSGFILTAPLAESLGTELARLPGLTHLDRISFLAVKAEGQSVMLLARTFSPDAELPLDLREGQPGKVRERLRAGEAVIGTTLARRLHLTVGDWLTLDSSAGPRRVRIAGTVTEYAAGGRAVYLDWQTAHRLFDFEGVHVFLATLEPEASPEVAAQLQQFCAAQGLLLQSNADLRVFIERLLGRVTALLWVLITLAFLIAALGILNTLAMNVLDQAHETGILRALGLTRARIARSFLYQGLLLISLSCWPAAPAGVVLAWLLNRAAGRSFGQEVLFQVQPFQILGCLGLAYLIGFLATCLAVRRKWSWQRAW